MVRLAECKGSNLITLKLSYNPTAIELISVPTNSQTLSNVIRDGNLSFPTKSRYPQSKSLP